MTFDFSNYILESNAEYIKLTKDSQKLFSQLTYIIKFPRKDAISIDYYEFKDNQSKYIDYILNEPNSNILNEYSRKVNETNNFMISFYKDQKEKFLRDLSDYFSIDYNRIVKIIESAVFLFKNSEDPLNKSYFEISDMYFIYNIINFKIL